MKWLREVCKLRLGNPPEDCVAQVGPKDTSLARAIRNTLTRGGSASPRSSVMDVPYRPEVMVGELGY